MTTAEGNTLFYSLQVRPADATGCVSGIAGPSQGLNEEIFESDEYSSHTSLRGARIRQSAIREILSVLELDAEHGVLANNIRTLIIDERADELVESCSIRLEHDEGLRQTAEHIFKESFKQAWIGRLRSFGSNFDTPEYFEERLTLANACVRAKIPLGVLQLTYSLMQELLISAVAQKLSKEPETERSLIRTILKLTSLDLYSPPPVIAGRA